MSPVPSRDRLEEYALKGVHLGLRQVDQAPEQRRARWLRAQAVDLPIATGPRIAILTPRDWAVHVQWEGMIAQALRVRGARPHFITCGGGLEICDRANTYEAPPMPCTTCRHYVHGSIDAHGFPRVALSAGWEPMPGEWPELDHLSLDELFAVEDEGLALGKLIEVPVKWFLMRSQIHEEPLACLTTRRFLRSARRVAHAMDGALTEVDPAVLIVLNGLFLFESIGRTVALRRGIDVISYERGFVTNTLLFHRRAPDNLYEIGDVWDVWSQIPLTPDEEHELDAYLDDRRVGRRTVDKYWTDGHAQDVRRAASGGRRAVLFTNLTWDSAVLGQEVAFPSIHAWIDAAIATFAARPEHELIIRVHPAELKLPGKQTREPIGRYLEARHPSLPSNVRVIGPEDTTSSYTLMESSDLGLVFTSTTGLEMALRGKPVVVAGQTHYRQKGFTLDCADGASFERMIDDALRDPVAAAPDLDLVRRYAFFFFFRAPIDSPGVDEHEVGLARITTTDLADLAPGRSESLDRLCDGILHGGDFRPAVATRR